MATLVGDRLVPDVPAIQIPPFDDPASDEPRNAIDGELPLTVVRWLEGAWPHGMEDIGTLTLSGPIRIRRGRLPMRGDTTMRFTLGEGYVADIRIGFGPLTIIRGLDALVDGAGITVVGAQASIGPEIDQGTFLALWCESILFPSAWGRLPGLRWLPVDDTCARVALPFRRGFEMATLRFDPDEPWFPTSFEADRHREVGRPKIGWRTDFGAWHWRGGIAVPTELTVTWLDDGSPWLRMGVEDVVPNEPLDEHVERARLAIARAREQAG